MLNLRATKPVLTAATLVMAAMLVAACGVKGPLEPPGATAAIPGENKSAEAADPGSNSAAKPKPHEPFVLDGLLR